MEVGLGARKNRVALRLGMAVLVWLVFSLASLLVLFYWLVLSKVLPPTGNRLLDWMRDDYYYCVLVPLTLPVTVVAMYLSWFTKMLFRHN